MFDRVLNTPLVFRNNSYLFISKILTLKVDGRISFTEFLIASIV